MVLKLTNPVEQQRWDDHLRHYGRERTAQTPESEIIELSKEFSIKEIKREVAIGSERLTLIRCRAHRQGLL